MDRLGVKVRTRSLAGCLVAATLATGCVPTRPVAAPPPTPAAAPQVPILLMRPPTEARTDAKPAPAPCISAADLRRLRAARPKLLRRQPMPATPAERVARTAGQLGLYEATGAWADQVEDVLRQCD